MTPFTTLTSLAAPLLRDNVDTDAIIPSREMKSTGRSGLADGLFAPWRYLEGRVEDPAFVLNQPAFRHAAILAAGSNFGCGSSREHAVWALAEWGIRAVIAESFAPIFAGNCIRNGVLPVVLAGDAVRVLAGQEVAIDLAAQTVVCGGVAWTFAIDPEAKAMLLGGLDAIDLTLQSGAAIDAWIERDRTDRPWIYRPQPLAGEGDRPQDGSGVNCHLPPRTNAAIPRARALRRAMSPPEAILWRELRKRPAGLKFRRQHPADRYPLDFYCAAAKLCVEVDGGAHDFGSRPHGDKRRDAFLLENGIETVRILTKDVLGNLEGVLAHISKVASGRLPHHHSAEGPPPQALLGEDS